MFASMGMNGEVIMAIRNLNNFSNEELCDIYCNIENYEWDRRLGSKPIIFDSLHNCKQTQTISGRILRNKTKEQILAPYKAQIEARTTLFERRKYQYVVIWKLKTEAEFAVWWDELLSNGNDQGD